LANLCERQRICCCAVENEINVAIGLEDFSDAIAHTRCPAIVPVRWRATRIRFFQRLPCLWANRRGVIAGEFITLATLPHDGLANRLRAEEQMSICASCDWFRSNKERRSPPCFGSSAPLRAAKPGFA